MSYEEELEALQSEALAEIEGEDNDTNTDDSEREESIDSTDDDGEVEDDREDSEGDEGEDDFEDDEDLDDEDEDDSDDDDDTSDGEDIDSEESSSDFEPVEVKINGQTISLNSQEELMAFVKKGGQDAPKRHRKSQNEQIIEQGKLSQSDLTLLIDAKKGNKAAIAQLAKQANVDIYDLDEDAANGYQQEFQPQYASEVDEVAEDIMQDTQLHEAFKEVVNTVPQDFAELLATNADSLRNFAEHVKSGLAQKVIPEAIKAQMLHGGTFIDNYAKIGREMSQSKEAPEKSKTKRKENPRAEKLRQRAKNHKGSNKGTKTKISGDDIWNMSSEDFNNKYM